jgi:hypothetical protein
MMSPLSTWLSLGLLSLGLGRVLADGMKRTFCTFQRTRMRLG